MSQNAVDHSWNDELLPARNRANPPGGVRALTERELTRRVRAVATDQRRRRTTRTETGYGHAGSGLQPRARRNDCNKLRGVVDGHVGRRHVAPDRAEIEDPPRPLATMREKRKVSSVSARI